VQSLSRGAGRDGALAITQVEAMLGAPMTGAGGLQFKGTGMQQQSANVLMEIARKREQGLPVTAEDKRAYSLAYGELTVPKVVGSPSTGYSFVQNTLDPNVFPSPEGLDTPMRREPQVGQEVSPFGNELESPVSPASPAQPQPGPGARITPLSEPTKPQSADQAGRGALVSQGAVNATRVRDAIVNPDGSVNRDIVFSMSSDIPLLGKGLPGTEGRGVRSVLEDALASKLRLETGAQANAEELQNIIDRFMPSMLDDDATVRDKMKRLADYFGEALSKTDPALADKLISRAREDGNVPEPPPDESGAVFTGFDASSGVAVFKRPNGTFFGVAQRGS